MILIIDADTLSAPSLARLLRYNGYPAEVIPSPLEALAILPTNKPMAIVLDLQLPELSGLELLRALRRDPAYREVPLIVYTGVFSQAAAREALDAGARDVIVKGTVGTQSLLARIEKQLREGDESQA